MTLSINFSNDMLRVLRKKEDKYEWQVDWPADGERWLVDVGGIPRDNSPWILIEVELKRDDPVGNVVKILQWAKGKRVRNRIILFQAFSKHYWEKRERLRLRAEFIGQEMVNDKHVRIQYVSLPMKDYKPGKGKTQGAGRRRIHAQKLAKTILRLIR